MNVPLYPVTIFLGNRTTDFDENLHVVQACTKEGFEIGGMSRYPLVCLHRPYTWYSSLCMCPLVMCACVPFTNLCMCPLFKLCMCPLFKLVHVSLRQSCVITFHSGRRAK